MLMHSSIQDLFPAMFLSLLHVVVITKSLANNMFALHIQGLEFISICLTWCKYL